jgi:hypothetical protein
MPESRESEASYQIVVEECGWLLIENFKIDVTSTEAR